MEARQLLAFAIGGFGTVEFGAMMTSDVEGGSTVPGLLVTGDLTHESFVPDSTRTITFTTPTGTGITAGDVTVTNFVIPQADYGAGSPVDLSTAIVVQDDNLVEGPETFNIGISTAGSLTIGVQSTTQHEITDNDLGEWNLTQSAMSVAEGDTQTYTFSLTPSGSESGDPFLFQAGVKATVEVQVVDMGTTIGDDYPSPVAAIMDAVDQWNDDNSPSGGLLEASFAGGPAPVVLTYTAGSNGDGTGSDTTMADFVVMIEATDDSCVEGPEDVQVLIENPGNATTGANIMLGMETTVTTTITDNDMAEWSLTQSATSVAEGATQMYTFALTPGGSGSDPFVFQAGVMATVEVQVVDMGTTIGDDYPSPVAAIMDAVDQWNIDNFPSSGLLEASFAGGPAPVILTYTAGSNGDGTGSVTTMPDLVVMIEATDDLLVEGPEDVQVLIENPGNGHTGADIMLGMETEVTTTIDDNEFAEWSLTQSTAQATDGVDEGSLATYTFSLTANGTEGLPFLLQSGEVATVEVQVDPVDTTIGLDYPSPVGAIMDAVAQWNIDNSPSGGFLEASFAGGDAPVILTYTAGSDDGDGGGDGDGDGPGGATAMEDLVVMIEATDDSLIEGPEDVRVFIENPGSTTGADITLGIDTEVITTINDNDTALVEFDEVFTSDDENEMAATSDGPTLVVKGDLTLVSDAERTVILSSLSGIEITPADVTLADAIFVIPAGVYSGTDAASRFNLIESGNIVITNDSLLEGDELFSIGINGLGTSLETGDANGDFLVNSGTSHDILDDEQAVINIVVGSPLGIFGEASSEAEVTTELSITGSGPGTLSVAPGVTLTAEVVDNGTGSATVTDDYTFATGQLVTYGPGSISGDQQTVSLTIVEDTLVEGNETINFGLANLVNNYDGQVTLGSDQDVIIDDNDEANVEFSIAPDTTTGEDTSYTVTVKLNMVDTATALALPVTVDVVPLMSSTAMAMEDFTLSMTSVMFASGSTDGAMEMISLIPVDDSLVEGNETVDLELQNVTSLDGQVTIGMTSAQTITIEDNDEANVEFSVAADTTSEGMAYSVTVKLNMVASATELAQPVTVEVVDLLSGTALDPDDYALSGTNVTFASGSVDGDTQTITLTPVDDSLVESGETVDLELQEVTELDGQVSIGTISNQTVTIEDNDIAVLSVTDIMFTEENNIAIVTVTVNNAVDGGFSVDYATADDTATNSEDYRATSGTLNFEGTAGETQTFEVGIKEDSIFEMDETFNIMLSNVTASLVDPASIDADDLGVITIVDDEALLQVGESGTATDVDHQWKTINLNLTYENPVVIAGPSTTFGTDPVTVRVRNVTSNSFEIRIEEWDYLDDFHLFESIDYMVIEAGTHQLADGSMITAGNNDIGSDPVEIQTGVEGIFLSTIVTDNDPATATVRVSNEGAMVTLQLQEEEAADGVHGTETVSWIQITSGSGSLNGMQYLVGQASVTHDDATIDFADNFDTTPVFLAGMQTFLGPDTATVRRTSLNSSEAVVFLEEETSADAEIFHTTETVGFLALSPGIFNALIVNGGLTVEDGNIGETGRVVINDLWTQVHFTHSYADPVVVMGALSTNGTNPSTTRIRNVTSTGFEVRVQEWDYLDGVHVDESVGFIVMEAGIHILEDGTQVIAANESAQTGAFDLIEFPTTFDNVPVVFSQVTSVNEPSAVISRQNMVTTDGFVNWLQEEEAGSVHGAEQISWIAIDQAQGVNNSLSFESDTTGDVVDHNDFELTFGQDYDATPAFFAQVQSLNGADTNTVRYRDLDQNGSTIFLEEEASLDTELFHITEDVGFLAFGVGSIIAEPPGRPATPTAPISSGSSTDTATSASLAQPLATSATSAQPLNNGIPELSKYEFDEALPTVVQQRPTASQSELAGAIELSEAKVDAAFAELTQEDVEIDSDFFDLL